MRVGRPGGSVRGPGPDPGVGQRRRVTETPESDRNTVESLRLSRDRVVVGRHTGTGPCREVQTFRPCGGDAVTEDVWRSVSLPDPPGPEACEPWSRTRDHQPLLLWIQGSPGTRAPSATFHLNCLPSGAGVDTSGMGEHVPASTRPQEKSGCPPTQWTSVSRLAVEPHRERDPREVRVFEVQRHEHLRFAVEDTVRPPVRVDPRPRPVGLSPSTATEVPRGGVLYLSVPLVGSSSPPTGPPSQTRPSAPSTLPGCRDGPRGGPRGGWRGTWCLVRLLSRGPTVVPTDAYHGRPPLPGRV